MSREKLEKYHHSIYFYCDPRQGIPEAEKLQHPLICLAEGFKELGVPFFSNANYWQESPEKEEYLFRRTPDVTPDDCSIVILQNNWFADELSLPENLFHRNRKYAIVYMDAHDNDKTYVVKPEFKKFDFIFRNHFNSKFKYGSNFYPWPFGLNSRMLGELQEIPDFQERKRQLLINFRADHTVRELSCKLLIPRIEKILRVDQYTNSLQKPPLDPYHHLRWLQTGRRHYPDYYKRLKDSAACACFGGFFVPPFPKDPGHVISRLGRRVMTKLKIKSNTIAQWDSWRFWESLAAGCASFHVDFEKYGLGLPVMPENWRHYIGIDLDNVQEAIDRIADEPKILERVARSGRIWALENYTPAPLALRLLETVSQS